MNKKIFRDELADWNTNASFYEHEKNSPLGKIFLREKLDIYAIPKNKQKILDLGAGLGDFSYYLSLLGHEVTALDFSSKMAGIARKNYPELKYIVASAENLPFPSDSFDFVIADSLLHHLKVQGSLMKAVEEVRRVLKPNGCFCIFDRNGSFLSNSLLFLALKGKRILTSIKGGHFPSSATRHEIPFTEKDIQSIVKGNFVILRRRHSSTLPVFVFIVATNGLSYLFGYGFGHFLQNLLSPLISWLENFFSFSWFTVEQALKLQKSANPLPVKKPGSSHQAKNDVLPRSLGARK